MPGAIAIQPIGRERQSLVTIDDFAPDPDALRAAALGTTFGPAGHHYPGLRAPVPESYMRHAMPVIVDAIGRAYDHNGAVDVVDASFSIVTTPPAALTVPQRLPHCDAFEAERIALVHYLPPDRDGTAFYRHRATGFEFVDAKRASIYFGQLEAELRHGGPPEPAYIAADTPLFERIALAPAFDNRAVLYRSYALHSGAIAPDASLSADPAVGRLTVTAFLELR